MGTEILKQSKFVFHFKIKEIMLILFFVTIAKEHYLTVFSTHNSQNKIGQHNPFSSKTYLENV